MYMRRPGGSSNVVVALIVVCSRSGSCLKRLEAYPRWFSPAEGSDKLRIKKPIHSVIVRCTSDMFKHTACHSIYPRLDTLPTFGYSTPVGQARFAISLARSLLRWPLGRWGRVVAISADTSLLPLHSHNTRYNSL